ncbi:hypothetical protein CONLIGDRAFT_120240 [Coniochaeta ligniaria NRRL 30616]|uniref:Uncharacterized protein n=1 Tax=Coniochaeta ligniaria NRRL 30616 TaxID=1408157 RepID=A0A1J7J463_9PEZI|nr:hypothetical protein CONLIGDRAFT_120240 [Coniochaeta ligniaria NRRL 30616]
MLSTLVKTFLDQLHIDPFTACRHHLRPQRSRKDLIRLYGVEVSTPDSDSIKNLLATPVRVRVRPTILDVFLLHFCSLVTVVAFTCQAVRDIPWRIVSSVVYYLADIVSDLNL